MAAGGAAEVVGALRGLRAQAVQQGLAGHGDAVDRAAAPVLDLLGVVHAPEHVFRLVPGVAADGGVALAQGVGHVAVAQRGAVASVARGDELAVPGLALGHPEFEVDVRSAGGVRAGRDQAEGRQVGLAAVRAGRDGRDRLQHGPGDLQVGEGLGCAGARQALGWRWWWCGGAFARAAVAAAAAGREQGEQCKAAPGGPSRNGCGGHVCLLLSWWDGAGRLLRRLCVGAVRLGGRAQRRAAWAGHGRAGATTPPRGGVTRPGVVPGAGEVGKGLSRRGPAQGLTRPGCPQP